jgi:hypothetical protein
MENKKSSIKEMRNESKIMDNYEEKLTKYYMKEKTK